MPKPPDRKLRTRPEPRWDQRTIPQHVHSGWLQYLLTRRRNEESLWWPRTLDFQDPPPRHRDTEEE